MKNCFLLKLSHKKNIVYICFFLIIVVQMINSIEAINQIGWMDAVCKAIELINYCILVGIILTKGYSVYVYFFIPVLGTLLVYGYIHNHKSAFLIAVLALTAAYGCQYNEVLQTIYDAMVLVVCVGILIGIAHPTTLKTEFSDGLRLGFSNSNVLGCFFCLIFLLRFYLYPTKRLLSNTLIYAISVFIITRCRTAACLIVLFPVIVLIYSKMITKWKGILTFAIGSLPIIFFLFTYYTAKWFPTNDFVQKINKIFSNRIFLNWFILNKNKVTAFGSNIQLHYSGVYNEIIGAWNITTTIDGTYTILLLVFGIIPSCIFIITFYVIIYKGVKSQDCIFLATATVIMTYAFMETKFTNIFLNFIFFYLTTSFIGLNRRDEQFI